MGPDLERELFCSGEKEHIHEHGHSMFRRRCGFWHSLRMGHVPGEASGGAGDEAGETNYGVRVTLWGRELYTYLNLDFML